MLPNVVTSSIGLLFFFSLSGFQQSIVFAEEPWRFINMADFHGGEEYVKHPVMTQKQFDKMDGRLLEKFNAIQAINQDYGGELVIIPGDTNSGHWYQKQYLTILNVKTFEQSVRKAGRRSYESLRYIFSKAGYDKLLVAVGDHELGGNSWPAKKDKTELLPNFRQAFDEGLNRDSNGNFLFQENIGTALSRPIGTPFEGTSHAHQHKNVLFVTVDAFHQRRKDFFNKKQGLGGEGSVTCTVEGDHLAWFKNVLQQAREDDTIDHIIVQAHLPILQPVRKAYCSGQFMDKADESDFWKAMRKYKVDLYFAGEVHSNTATKDDESNLIQVVSRGNSGNNFLTIDVTETTLKLTSYKEVGDKWKFNGEYEEQGSLFINKWNQWNTNIKSKGNLELLDRTQPMIHLTFEETVPLSDRPITVLKHDDYKETLLQTKVTIRGVECSQSFINYGAYGQDYDALTANVELDNNDSIRGNSAVLNSANARIAVDGLGPHSGGEPVSYSLWFKTNMQNAHLIHYGKIFGGGDGEGEDKKNFIFTLALLKGRPAIHATDATSLVLKDKSVDLSDNKWHHVAISMPKKSCLLSEVKIWVDGKRMGTRVAGTDHRLFFFTAGRVSVGSLGRSGDYLDNVLPDVKNFVGKIDEVYVWGRPLDRDDIDALLVQ